MARFFLTNPSSAREHLGAAHLPLVSWRSIVAGLVLSIICYVALSALGVALVGASTPDLFRGLNKGAAPLAIGTGIWMIISLVMSLLAGGYFAARISNLVTNKIGGAQGLVIASLFFCAMFIGARSVVGALGRTMGTVAQTTTSTGDALFSFPMMVDIAEQNLDGLNLKVSSRAAAKGIVSRLIRGDLPGATKYLSMQSGVSANKLAVRMDLIRTTLRYNLNKNADQAAWAFRVMGWTVFLGLLLGVGSAVLGGLMGAQANNRKPLVDQIEPLRAVPEQHVI